MKSNSFPRQISGTLSLPCSEPLPLLKSHFKTFLFVLAYDWLRPHSSFFPLSPWPHPSTLPSPSTVRTLACLFPPSSPQPLACYPAGLHGPPSRGLDLFGSARAFSEGVSACLPASQGGGNEFQWYFCLKRYFTSCIFKLQAQALEKQNTKGPCNRPAKLSTPRPVSLGILQVEPEGEVGIKPRPHQSCCFTCRIKLWSSQVRFLFPSSKEESKSPLKLWGRIGLGEQSQS